MLKKMLNEASITFQIEATGPILIKEGDKDTNEKEEGDEKRYNVMEFVVDANDEIFIPGSSIRGVWRSWCEKIARTISDNDYPLSCDPFDDNTTSIHLSCSKRLENNDPYIFSWDNIPGNEEKRLINCLKNTYHLDWVDYAEISKSDDTRTIQVSKDENLAKIVIDQDEKKATLKSSNGKIHELKVIRKNSKLNIYEVPCNIYAISCPICKLFGNTSLGSRIRISDAYLSDKGSKTRDNLGKRAGIGIDRFTGGVSKGPFKSEYVMGRIFEANVHIRNFELWQLGLLAFLLRDFEEKLVPIGFGKTRGFGKVKGTVESMSITYYGLDKPQINESTKKVIISGIGNLYNDADKDIYCFADKSAVEDVEFNECIENPIKLILKLDATQASSLFNKSAPHWVGGEGDTIDGYYLKAKSMRKDIIEKNHDEDKDV